MSVFNGPITAGVLGTVDKKNLSASYFAPAGAGPGPIGPNPVVSSITLGGQFPAVNMADGGLFFTNNGFDTTSTIVAIDYNPTAPSGGGIGGPDFTTIQAGTLNSFPVLDLGLGGDGRIALVLNSTMSIVGDSVNISSLTISSINGGAYPPAAALPEDAGFNNLECSTIGVGNANGLSIAGFPQPLITYGATTLNGSGTATVGLDHTYTDPYYPFVTYRGTLGANTSTLSVSTLAGDQFAIYGEANASVQYMVCGN